MVSDDIKKALSADLNRNHVLTRNQAGQTLSYIAAWHAIAEANRIFGFEGWSRETVSMTEVRKAELVDGKWRVGFVCKVRVEALGTFRDGTGYGSGIAKDLGDAYESAVKEAESDAMKRALMTFGNPFGLALYDKSHAAVSDPSKASASQMKRGLEEIENDLLDCKTVSDVQKCGNAWKHIFERDGWSKDYVDFARGKFAQRIETIKAAVAADQSAMTDPNDIPFD